MTVCVPAKGNRTTSGLFCAQFLKSEKKISKRVLAKSMDLNLYPRHFEPLFREFFRKAARFYSRQNVEFEQVFLLVLLDGHSECMCHCVDTGKAQNTLLQHNTFTTLPIFAVGSAKRAAAERNG